MLEQKQCVSWLFGRGASADCNLNWQVPKEWQALPRDQQIERIKGAVRLEMGKREIDISPYEKLLSILSEYTTGNWCHYFITTNWDYLLQRAIAQLKLKKLPSWMVSSHVFHLNGSVEENTDNRSPFLLETDIPAQRTQSVETNSAFNHIIWERFFVVVGLSFKCKLDQSLPMVINKVQDDLPIGESEWLIINNNREDLEEISAVIKRAIPCASTLQICIRFKEWVKMPLVGFESMSFGRWGRCFDCLSG